MKKIKFFLLLPLLAGGLLLSSFSPKQERNAGPFTNYAWYTPSGEFVAWSTLLNAEVVTGDDTNPAGGTLELQGFTNGGPGQPPSGTLTFSLYSHP